MTNLFGSPALLRRVGEYGASAEVRAADAAAGDLGRGTGAGVGASRRSRACSRRASRSTPLTERPKRCRSPRSAATRSWARPVTRPTAAPGSASAGPSPGCGSRSSGSTTRPIAGMVRRAASPRRPDRRDRRPGAGRHPAPTSIAPRPTALAKIADPGRGRGRGRGFWHRMGDLGYRDNSGPALVLRAEVATGCHSPEETLYTIPCEGVFNTHPEVRRTALVGVERAGADRTSALRRTATVWPRSTRERRAAPPRTARAGRRRFEHTRTDRRCPLSPRLSGRHPPQRQDLPREAGGLGSQEAEPAMNALVTGGGGFLGGAIVRALVARGDRVVSLSRSDYPALRALGVEHVQADLADAEAVNRAIKGHDLDVVFTSRPGPGSGDDTVTITRPTSPAPGMSSMPATRGAYEDSSTPARRASSSTAATWKGSTSRSPIPRITTHPIRPPRPRPSNWSGPPTTRPSPRCRSGRI